MHARRLLPALLPALLAALLAALTDAAPQTEDVVTSRPKPFCQMSQVMPCYNKAVRSYVRNTRGEEAAQGEISQEDARVVSDAMGTDISAPWADVNHTCKTASKVDFLPFADCVEKATKDCTVDVPQDEDLVEDFLPSMRNLPMVESARFARYICEDECLLNSYSFPDRFSTMKDCWRDTTAALDAVEEGTSTESDCGSLDNYMQCQWNNSIGCPYLEAVTRAYLKKMTKTIERCDVFLPYLALNEPKKMVSSGSALTGWLAAPLSVLLSSLVITAHSVSRLSARHS